MGLGSSFFFPSSSAPDANVNSNGNVDGKPRFRFSPSTGPGDAGGGDAEDADEDILDLRQQFHNTVRENVIFLLFFLTLCMISWTVIGVFIRRKDKDERSPDVPPPPADDDESLVYRICFWLCVFSLSISMGATLLLPISIVSNEVLLLYPQTYYVQWLNAMLIQGLWNLIFLFANISLFILLPFSHLFIESEGFSGNKKGLAGKFYETVVVLILSGFAIWGISHILASVFSPTNSSVLGGLFNLIGFSNQLPFIYSCISFFGVLLLLLCTPLGAGHLFTVLSQLLVGPQFLRNLEEEHRTKFLEIVSLKNRHQRKINNTNKMNKDLLYYYENKKLEKTKRAEMFKRANGEEKVSTGGESGDGKPLNQVLDIFALKDRWEKSTSGMGDEGDDDESINVDAIVTNRNPEFLKMYQRMISINPQGDELINEDDDSIRKRIKGMEDELVVLEQLMKTPRWKRNLLYPLAFLIVLVLTALTVFMVIINTLQLMVGLKALPLSAQSFSLGLSSMSVLGAWGAGLEVILILYLMTTSIIGLYSLPGIRRIKPRTGDSPTSHIIYNCALVLILSSALPLLSRILGITNFDLLGNYGKIEWLGNFYIVFLYNIIFSVASTLCLVNKFTSAIRQELFTRLKSVFRFRLFQSNPLRPLGGGERGKSPSSNGTTPTNSLPNTPLRNSTQPTHIGNGDKSDKDPETKKTL